MKKKFVSLSWFLVISILSVSQISSREYEAIKKRADSLYNLKDYKNAATVYTSAIRNGAGLVTSYNRWTAACYWMAANIPDSAYLQLEEITMSKDLDFTDMQDLFTDGECFSTLYDQSRWKSIKERTFLNFYRRYLSEINEATEENYKSKQSEEDITIALSSNDSNFFTHLNDPVYEFLKRKMYKKACGFAKVSIRYFPSNHLFYYDVANCYKAMGDAERSFAYYSRGMNQMFKGLVYNIDTALNFQSLIINDYKQLSQEYGMKAVPTDVMLFVLANALLRSKAINKAYSLCKMNIGHHPASVLANRSMSNYFKAVADKENEEKFSKLAQKYMPQPPARNVSLELKYDASVNSPSCTANCPVILFDAAHNNYHTASGRYKPYAELMANDGFKVIENKAPFTKEMLAKTNVVIIASPNSSFSITEIKLLNDWIKKGGSFLAITDHDNFSFDNLLESLGVKTPETNFTDDTVHARIMKDGVTKNPRHIVFSANANLLGDHPIINGKNGSEKINVVMTFSGRTIIAPPESSLLLRLSETAISYLTIEPTQRTIEESVAVKCNGARAFGTAFNFGKGKVVVVGEAAMQTVQQADGGFNTPGCDNKQFALNIMRWLTGYLK